VGGEFLLKLNIDERPIANKYREGKVKRTLKRELKVREIVNGEAIKGPCVVSGIQLFSGTRAVDRTWFTRASAV
jgi:hypothetical protein